MQNRIERRHHPLSCATIAYRSQVRVGSRKRPSRRCCLAPDSRRRRTGVAGRFSGAYTAERGSTRIALAIASTDWNRDRFCATRRLRMFSQLGDKLQDIFKDLRGHGTISETNINDALRQVRLALLEADVDFQVAKQF